MFVRLLLILGCLFAGSMAAAADLAVVEQLVPPAWLVRAGGRTPLSPGLALRSGDRVDTGADARVYLQLAEGSRIKLGADASFRMQSDASAPERLLTGLFEVLTGAFRFTTGLNAARGARDLRIRVVTATIGIRGTDVWGKAGADRDLVALIEGDITLERNGQRLAIAPMQYMDAPSAGAAKVSQLDTATLLRLAEETEIGEALRPRALRAP